jgi:NTE family protein
MAAIEDKGFKPSCLAGTSAGAIVASMRAAGYAPDEMWELINDIDFKKFKDGAPWGTKLLNLRRWNGIYRGDTFLRMMEKFMSDRGILTFGQLRNPNDSGPKRRYRLTVFAADLTRGSLVTWPNDAVRYGLDPDAVSVAWAVRSSMSIPGFFRPVKIGKSCLVDGGLLSNYPIAHFDTHKAPRFPTFGLNLCEADSGKPNDTSNLYRFLMAMVKTSMEAMDRRAVRDGDAQYRTIRIPVGNATATDFDISAAKKLELYDSGYQAASDFLHRWRWEDYLAWAKQVRGVE